MNLAMGYPYSDKEITDKRQPYAYAEFRGEAFLRDYLAARHAFLATNGGILGTLDVSSWARLDGAELLAEPIETKRVLEAVTGQLLIAPAAVDEGLISEPLHHFTRKFEVTRRLFPHYPAWKRKGQGEERDLALYATFACALAAGARAFGSLKFLNTLLKVNDLIISWEVGRHGDAETNSRVRFAVTVETRLVERLMS